MKPLAQRMKAIELFTARDGAARARESPRGARPLDHSHGDRRTGLPDAAADLRGRHPRAGTRQPFLHAALGLPALREAVAGYYRAPGTASSCRRRASPSPPDPAAALLLALAAIVDPGAEVLVSDPGYPANRHFVRLLNGEPVNVPVGADSNYQMTPELVEHYWSDRTCATVHRHAV